MTNLPIATSNPQSPANAALANGAVLRNEPSSNSGNAAPTSQASGISNDRIAETFSFLLARQIGEAGLPTIVTTPVNATIDGKTAVADAHQGAKDVQVQKDQNATAALASSDPSSALVAMFLQIPVQRSDVPSTAMLVIDSPLRLGNIATDRGQGSLEPLIKLASGLKQNISDRLQQSPVQSTEKDSVLATTSNMQQPEPSAPIAVISEAVKPIEILARSDGQPQIGQSNSATGSPSFPTTAILNHPTHAISSELPQTITTPLGKSGWSDEFSQKIIWVNTQQSQTAQLHLNPPDLGPLNVVMKISDNQVTVQFTSPHSAVRDAVENALPKLREILADNNIMLGNATVSDQPPRERSGDGFMNQSSGENARSASPHIPIEPSGVLPTIAQNAPSSRHNGLLDTFA